MQIAITTGEPAGVGPELTAQALGRRGGALASARVHRARRRGFAAERARAFGVDWAALSATASRDRCITGRSARLRRRASSTRPMGATCSICSTAAIDGALAGAFDAIVTAPLQKSTINDAGVPFTGHTEYLAERTHTPRVVMMLARHRRAAAARRAGHHASAAQGRVRRRSRRAASCETLRIVRSRLARAFRLAAPRIARDWAQSARGRKRLSRPRGNRRHRARDRSAARAQASTCPDRFRPTRCSSRAICETPTACSRCTTTRACRC